MDIKVVENYETAKITGETFIEYEKDSQKRLNQEIKAAGQAKRKKGATKEEKAKADAKLKLIKKKLEGSKKAVEEYKRQLEERKDQLIEENPDLKKYILFEQGKIFDKKISESKERQNLISIVKEVLENPDINKLADEYAKMKADNEEKIREAKKDPDVYKGFDEKILAQRLNAKKEELRKAFEKSRNNSLGKNVSFDELVKLIDSIPYQDNINTSLTNEGIRVKDKMAFRESQLADIIKQGQEMNVRFNGFTNSVSLESTGATKAIGNIVKDKFRYHIPFIGKVLKENAQNKATEEAKKKEQERLDAMESYGPADHKAHDFKANITVKGVIDSKLRDSRKMIRDNDKDIDAR